MLFFSDDQTRPVVLLAPLAEALMRKLTSESPDKYKHCEPCELQVTSLFHFDFVITGIF